MILEVSSHMFVRLIGAARVLQARYGIATDRVYAHNWIDYKDARYCEGCDLATLARSTAFSAKP
jgi:hypothetical protein